MQGSSIFLTASSTLETTTTPGGFHAHTHINHEMMRLVPHCSVHPRLLPNDVSGVLKQQYDNIIIGEYMYFMLQCISESDSGTIKLGQLKHLKYIQAFIEFSEKNHEDYFGASSSKTAC